MQNEKKNYTISIMRTGTKVVNFDVQGSDQRNAIKSAIEVAYNHDFGADDNSDYEVTHVIDHSVRNGGLESKIYKFSFTTDFESDDAPISVFECEASDFKMAQDKSRISFPDAPHFHVFWTTDVTMIGDEELMLNGIAIRKSQTSDEWFFKSKTDVFSSGDYDSLVIKATEFVKQKQAKQFDDDAIDHLMGKITDGNLSIEALCKLAVSYARKNPDDWVKEMSEQLDEENLENKDDTPDINVKSEFLIEALEYCIFTFDGYPNLDFNIFNHDDLDDVSGEIRFYSVSLAAGIEASEFEKVIAFSDIEKGRLDEDGAFVCNDISGSEIRIISSMFAESVVSKNKLYEVLSRVHHEALADPSP